MSLKNFLEFLFRSDPNPDGTDPHYYQPASGGLDRTFEMPAGYSPADLTGTMTKPYVDKTGTDEKPDPLRDVFQEFPLAMMELARITRMGATKYAPRSWQTLEHDYALNYHRSKIGRHLLKQETEGMENYEDIGVDGKPLLHPGQVAWNALAFLEHLMKQRAEERNE